MTIKLPIKREPLTIVTGNSNRLDLVLRAGELEKAVELAAVLLKRQADLYGFGEEYNTIDAWMTRVQGIYDEEVRILETGGSWRNGEIIL